MSCTDPILSIEALIQRAARYSAGCGVMKYAEADAKSELTCDEADTPDLVLLAMAFDTTANVFRVEITETTIADLCSNYTLRVECAGLTVSQALREAVTVNPTEATIRVLYVTDTTGTCNTDCDYRGLEELIGNTIVTDGTATYVVAVAPDSSPDDITCTTAEVGAQTFAKSSISQVSDCGIWAWRIEQGDLGGDFNDDFNDDFNI